MDDVTIIVQPVAPVVIKLDGYTGLKPRQSFVEDQVLTGSGKTWTLPFTPGVNANGKPAVLLFRNGVRIRPGIDFDIYGVTVSMYYDVEDGDLIADGYLA